MKTFGRTIQTIRDRIRSEQFLTRHRLHQASFSRKRKLGFMHCVALILSRLTLSLQTELNRYFDRQGDGMEVSQQAFSKARQHIDPAAFRELYAITVQEVLAPGVLRRYQGYRLFGIDGTEIALPTSEALSEDYPDLGKETLRRPRARVSVLCDLLDGYLLDARIATRRESERLLADAHLDTLSEHLTAQDILMMDRGYPSKALLAKLSEGKARYLMRVSSSFQAEIDQRTGDDIVIEMWHAQQTFVVRVVTITLETGEVETLLTNLDTTEFDTEAFGSLYAMRWGVETVINRIKNRLQLERFSGKTSASIEQDFYGAALLLNLATMLAAQAAQELAKKQADKALKYRYTPNYNLLVGCLKDALPDLLSPMSERKRMKLYRKLQRRSLQKPSPVKHGRAFPRGDSSHARIKQGFRDAF